MSALPINRAQQARPYPVPAPIGGLNAIDALAAMPPGDASTLENFIPHADRVETRAGFTLHATASSLGAGQYEGLRHLMTYSAGDSADAVFVTHFHLDGSGSTHRCRVLGVAINGTLSTAYDVAAGAGVITAMGEWTQYASGSGTSYLLFPITVSGDAASRVVGYDGSSWSELSITGLPVNILGVHGHKKRLWFYNKSSSKPLSAYYLPTGAIGGAVVEFNLGPFASKGGRLIAMRTITRDGGSGADDLALFLTNRGQALVYEGTDPASAATWRLVGVFNVAEPSAFMAWPEADTTRENMVRDAYAIDYGADVLLMTQAGLIPASSMLAGATAGDDVSISSKIQPLLTQASEDYLALLSTGNASWKMCFAPTRKQFIISVPVSESATGSPSVTTVVTSWYVMNTQTKAWTKFTGMNARDMLVVGKTIYFIDASLKIYKYDGTATSDNGVAITFECRQAYNYMQSPSNKLVTLMQPMLRATGNFSLTVEADADFSNGTISSYTSYTVGATANLQPQLSPAKYGRAIAAHLKGQTSAGVVSWYATNWLTTHARGA